MLDRITGIQEIWNHYAASIVFAKIPYIEVPSSRSGRIHGRPKMNFASLILHGLSAISIFHQTVFLRLLIVSLMLLTITLAVVFIIKSASIHVDITYLIMSVFMCLFFVLFNFTAIIFSLKSRNKAPGIPRQFWEHFIKKGRSVETKDYLYPGAELELFAYAINWKSYFKKHLMPYVQGRVLEVGAGIGETSKFLQNAKVSHWTYLEPDKRLFSELVKKNCRSKSGMNLFVALQRI